MKIPFIRASHGCPIETDFQGENGKASLKGEMSKFRELVKFEGIFSGNINQTCDVCCEDYIEDFSEEVTLFMSDGEYKDNHQGNENLDVVELQESFINFDEIIDSEIEIKRVDYHRCDNCKNKEIPDE